MENIEKVDKEKIEKNVAEIVANFAATQYSVHWGELFSMQASAGIILTVISICVSFISSGKGFRNAFDYTYCESLVVNIGFCISAFTAYVYMFLSFVFIFRILKSKKFNGIHYPVELFNQLMKLTEKATNIDDGIGSAYGGLLEKINSEMTATQKILNKNRTLYNGSLVTAALSVGGSFSAMFFSNNPPSCFIDFPCLTGLVLFVFVVQITAVALFFLASGEESE